MERLTEQQAFDIAAEGLLKQGQLSLGVPGTAVCSYRGLGPNGEILKCGVGFLMPDEWVKEHDPDGDDDSSAIDILMHKGKIPDRMQGLRVCFLQRLQSVHDKCDVALWPARLAELAKDFNLDAGVLEPWMRAK